jgi:hypothetical protein
MLKKEADLVTTGDHGDGVAELCQRILDDDLRSLAPRLTRHEILLGHRQDGSEVRVPPYGAVVLLAGTSGAGKSTLATGFLERLTRADYQYAVTDPEGDYQDFEDAIVLGGVHKPVTVDEVLQVIDKPGPSAVANMLGIALGHRPEFFVSLVAALMELRSRCGRPHWLVVDETHHMLPAARGPASAGLPRRLESSVFITVHPDQISPAVLSTVDLMLGIGSEPAGTLASFARAVGEPEPPIPGPALKPGEAIAWWRRTGEPPFWLKSVPPRLERKRHHRKYAVGELPPELSFFFRGADGRLNLRAQNLQVFNQMAAGVDDETWMHHLRRNDYSAWFREAIKDEWLAEATEAVEREASLDAAGSRARILALIEERYTGAA